jgi:iron(III) transport system permease protein
MRTSQGRFGLIVKAQALVILSFLLLPLAALAWLAMVARGGGGTLGYVLPLAVRDTVLLSGGVAVLTAIVGTAIAAVVTFTEFPLRRHLAWMAVLPLALPTYLIAYVFVELHGDMSAPFQALLPSPRSMPGAILVFATVLYPYVYLGARMAFLDQSGAMLLVARTLGSTPVRSFFIISLPLALPGVAAGLMLALMETLNDIGASEYLGVRTLAYTIYTTWLNRDDLAGATQLALVLVAAAVSLLAIVRLLRSVRQLQGGARNRQPIARLVLSRPRAAAAIAVCGLPFLAGFAVPVGFLVITALDGSRGHSIRPPSAALAGSLSVSTIAAGTCVVLAVLLAWAARAAPGRLMPFAGHLASYGYALPGTVLALSTFVPAGLIDNAVDGWMREFLGVSTGLILSGSLTLVVYGYVVRFISVSHGAIDAAFSRVSIHLDLAARCLGRSPAAVFVRIPLSLSTASIAAAAVLTFVDCMKELPLTLLLRPLGFETLATVLYDHASRGAFEDGAAEALLLVMFGVASAYLGFVLGENRMTEVSRTGSAGARPLAPAPLP